MSRKRLRKVMAVQTTTYETERMTKFIVQSFNEIARGKEDHFSIVVDNNNIYITKGVAETYPCVIAHTDTVHDIVNNFEIFERKNVMFAMDFTTAIQCGIGGDDKVGVYVALEALRKHDVIKVAFFRDEEHGCLGSRDANMEWFNNVEFVLQCDRQGYKDFVSRIMGATLFDDKFRSAIKPYLKEYGKKETVHGGMTDVYQLVQNGLQVCVANMSCGYYSPHCDDEIIDIDEVFMTRDLVNDLISGLSGTVWNNSEYAKYKSYSGRYGEYWGGWDDELDSRSTLFSKGSSMKVYDNVDDYIAKTSDDDDIPEYLRKERDELTENDFTDLECVCCWCDGDQVMYDPHEDADWCFACNEYTNHYNHFNEYVDVDYDNIDQEFEQEEDFDFNRIKKLH